MAAQRGNDAGMACEFVTIVERGRNKFDIGNGLRGPGWLRIEAQLPEFDVAVIARIEPIAGVYEVTELSLARDGAAAPMTSELLRQIPLRTLVRRAVWSDLRSLNIGNVIAPEPRDSDPGMTQLRDVALHYRIRVCRRCCTDRRGEAGPKGLKSYGDPAHR